MIAQPCNQFGGQEPGSNAEVKAFAMGKGAKFPMLMKGDVNGAEETPLWTYLKSKKGGLVRVFCVLVSWGWKMQRREYFLLVVWVFYALC